jgi:multiple sugar transport system ATP-binding protein
MAELHLSALAKSFGTVRVLDGIDLTVADGEFMVLVGPSGCGKSTTLRLVAGLEACTEGRIHIGGRDVTGVAPAERGVAMVFQSYALYPHMTVAQNMGFALKMEGRPAARIEAAVAEAARTLQLEPLLQRRPRELSGGQRQRVAIGRAIVRQPQVFLFDEPLSNLDAGLRGQMRVELARLHQQLGATIVYVTHDQVEAMTLGQRVALFNAGRIEQVGPPLQLYRAPANRFVAAFLGSPSINFIAAQRAPGGGAPTGAHTLGVRPEHVEPAPDGAAGLATQVELVEELGDTTLVHLRTEHGDALVMKRPSAAAAAPARHQALRVRFDARHLLWFDSAGRALHEPTDRLG